MAWWLPTEAHTAFPFDNDWDIIPAGEGPLATTVWEIIPEKTTGEYDSALNPTAEGFNGAMASKEDKLRNPPTILAEKLEVWVEKYVESSGGKNDNPKMWKSGAEKKRLR